MNKIIQTIENDWKLEAKLEDNKRYFYHTNVVDKLLSGNKAYVIGRKGSGKTAIAQNLITKTSHDRFSEKLTFKNFPFEELYSLKDEEYSQPNEYITIWKFVIYSQICKLMIKNENIPFETREKLNSLYKNDIKNSLSRTLKNWISSSFGIQILGNGIDLSIQQDTTKNDKPWIERVNILEDFLFQNLDLNSYIIVFDELDEDYKKVLEKKYNERYISLITSLFKAVQDIRSKFSDYKLYPVIFLRDDIYDLITDADKTKWNDFKYNIEWNEQNIKKLIAFRISRAINPDGQILTFEQAWSKIIQPNQIGYGDRQSKQTDTFSYMIKSTLYRPRDIISYLKSCSEYYINLDNVKYISPSIIKKADKAFSNYLKSEVSDEVSSILPEINEILDIFSKIRKQTLSIEEFEIQYKESLRLNEIKEERSTSFILSILFAFSVIGNQPRQRNTQVFKYISPEARLNQNEKIIVHRGLFKSLQIL